MPKIDIAETISAAFDQPASKRQDTDVSREEGMLMPLMKINGMRGT